MDKNNVTLCSASLSDAEFLWRLANDETVRAQSFNGRRISWDDHIWWLDAVLGNIRRKQLIVKLNYRPVGQVRLDMEDFGLVISVSIDKDHRGMGLGYRAINVAKTVAKTAFPQAGNIDAFIKPDNTASIRMFTKAGFTHMPYTHTLMDCGNPAVWMTCEIDRRALSVGVHEDFETKMG